MTSRLPTPGSDDGTWGYVLNDFLSQSLASDGTLIASSIAENKLSSGVVTKLNSTNGVVISNTPASLTQVLTATGSTSAAWAAPAVGLTSTTTQTANFTAVAGNAYLVGTGSGAITVTLPTSTGSFTQLAIKKASSDTNLVTISGTINGTSSSSLVLTLLNEAKVLIADGSGGWNGVAGDQQLSQLDARYMQTAVQSAGGDLTGTYPNPTLKSAVIKSGSFTLQDTTDTTKQLKFDISAVTTGTTITPQLPNSNSQLVNLVSTQTLTNKTLTAPVVSTPLIQYSMSSITGATTLTTANRSVIYTVDATSGSFTITLPSAAIAGYQYFFKRLDLTSNVVTISVASSPVFDGGFTSIALTDRNQYVELTSATTSGTYYTTRNSIGIPGGKNLVQNGSFENGIGNFSIANGATIASDSTVFRTGLKSVQVTHVTSSLDNGLRISNYISGALPLNTPYIVQAWVYIAAATAPTNGVRISVQGSGVGQGGGYSSYAAVTNTWIKLQISFVTALTAGPIQIYTISAGSTAGQIHNVDDVSLQEGTVATGYTPSTDDSVDLYSAQTITGAKTLTTSGLTFTDGTNITLQATTGTKIGTGATQKLGFYNATPVAQQAAATDIGTVLSNLGIRVAGTAYPLTTTGAVSVGSLSATGSFRFTTTTQTASATLTVLSSLNQICNATTAAFTLTLPATTSDGIEFLIKKIDSSVNTITIAGTIDGATNAVLASQYKYIRLISTTVSGSWYTVGNN